MQAGLENGSGCRSPAIHERNELGAGVVELKHQILIIKRKVKKTHPVEH